MKIRCRTCYSLTDENQTLSLLTEYAGKLLATMLNECTTVKVLERDSFSQKICISCKIELIRCFNFHDRCIRVQQLFNSNENTHVVDAEKNNFSAIFLIDTEELKQDFNFDDNKENFNENTIHDDENFFDNNENDEIKATDDHIKYCSSISGMNPEEILSIIDNETPDIGEEIKRQPSNIEKEDPPKKLSQEEFVKYKYLCEKQKARSIHSKTRGEVVNLLDNYLNKRAKMLPVLNLRNTAFSITDAPGQNVQSIADNEIQESEIHILPAKKRKIESPNVSNIEKSHLILSQTEEQLFKI